MSHELLKVTMSLGSSPVFYEPPTLDGILAYAVVFEETAGAGYPESAEPYPITLPVARLWESESGLPLWAATRFFPIGENHVSQAYWHKREFTPEFLKPKRDGSPANVNFTNGVHKAYRIPMPVHSAREWCAYVQGDCDAIASCLSRVSAVGKKRAYGYGQVLVWDITPLSDEQQLPLVHEGRLLKALPLAYALSDEVALSDAAPSLAFCGWTPPYWHGACMAECLT